MYSRFSIIIRWLIFIRNAARLILSQLIRRNDVDSTLFTFHLKLPQNWLKFYSGSFELPYVQICRADKSELFFFFLQNRPFVASRSRGTKLPYWRAKVALGQDKQRKLPFKIIYVFCLSYPSATFVLQYGGFVPRERLAAKGLFSVKVIASI